MPATELLAAAIGSMLLGIGIATTGAWALNRGRPDRTLVLFGLWCGLYGAGMIMCQNARGTFITAIYAVIDAERGTIVAASAGHPPLLIARTDGTVQAGIERGFMLGLTPDARYAAEEWPLPEGDRVLLYSDGITEALNPRGEFLDQERLAAWLSAAEGTNPDHVADLLLGRLRALCSGQSSRADVPRQPLNEREQRNSSARSCRLGRVPFV